MSILRLLSPIRETGPPVFSDFSTITLDLQMPTNGFVFMKPPDDPLWPHAVSPGRPREDQLLSGVLVIHVPPSTSGARRRCRSIRVGMRTICKLNMGAGRGWEEDTIFERKTEMMAGNSEGIVLMEGVQLFEYTLILPSTLAPHDRHPNAKVRHELFAEVEGIPGQDWSSFQSLSLFGFGHRRNARSGRRSGEPSRSPSPSPSQRFPSAPGSPLLAATGSMSITRQEETQFDLVPTYEQSQTVKPLPKPLADDQSAKRDEWISGTLVSIKAVGVIYNPNPTGDINELDITQNGYLDALGIWVWKISSDVLTVGGPIHTRMYLACADPKTTIFAWSLSLRQTHTIASPRDDPESTAPISTTRVFTIISQGIKPSSGRTGLDHPALWRGREAGGQEESDCTLSGSSNLPVEDHARPTTLPGTITPIKVSHVLQYQLYFSVWGQDDAGRLMRKPGPGGMRFMDISKPLILPGCSLIRSSLDLPKYERGMPGKQDGDFPHIGINPSGDSSISGGNSCLSPSAGMPTDVNKDETHTLSQASWCRICRSYHDETKPHLHGFVSCACDLTVKDMAERMRALEAADESEAEGGGAMSQKEAAERGEA